MKSVTYEATFPLFTAAIIAPESTSSALARLIILTPSFIFAMDSAFIIPVVSFVAGT